MIRDVELKQTDSDKIKNQIEFGLIPLSKWNEFFVYPTVATIRQLYFNAYKYRKTDFDKCIKRVGCRIYINVDEFKNWLKNRKEN